MSVAQDKVQSQDNENVIDEDEEGAKMDQIDQEVDPAAQQDIPSEIDIMMPRENLNEFKNNLEQIQLEKIFEQQEEQLLLALDSHSDYQHNEL